MEAFHHFVHVREDLRERYRIDEPDNAEGRKLRPGEGRDFVRLCRLLVFEGAIAIEGVVIIVVEQPAGLFLGRGTGGMGVDGHGAQSSRRGEDDKRRAALEHDELGYKRGGSRAAPFANPGRSS